MSPSESPQPAENATREKEPLHNLAFIRVDANTDSDDEEDLRTFNPVRHFVKHLSKGFFCTPIDHDTRSQRHEQWLIKHGESHGDCQGIHHLWRLMDPKRPSNRHVPNFLEAPYVYRGGQFLQAGKTSSKGQSRLRLTDQIEFEPPAVYKQMFEGTADSKDLPPRICMLTHEPRTLQGTPAIHVDVDSAMGFVSSPAAFREGWNFIPVSTAGNLINGKIHGVRMEIWDEEENKTFHAPIEAVPHILFGSLSHMDSYKLYLLFPRLWITRNRPDQEARLPLSNEQLETLHDLVLFPAFAKVLPESQLAEFPSTFKIAQMNARASANERGRQTTLGEHTSHTQLLRNNVQARFSDLFWCEALRLVEYHELEDFRDMQIFYNAKDMKGATGCTTYTELQSQWNRSWSNLFNDEFMPAKDQYLDLGRQFLPTHREENPLLQTPTTLLWRQCCIETYHAYRTKQYHHASGIPLTLYPLAGVKDLCSASMTASVRSPQYRAGCPFSHFYSKSKTGFVASTVEIFENPDIEVLGFGGNQINLIRTAGGGAPPPTFAQAALPYIHSKGRASHNLEEQETHNIQAREEHRLRKDVFTRILQGLADLEQPRPYCFDSDASSDDSREEPPQPQAAALSVTPFEAHMTVLSQEHTSDFLGNVDPINRSTAFFSVPTRSFVGFLRGNLNKNCMGFEIVLARLQSERVALADTTSARLFYQAIRYSALSKLPWLAPHLYKTQWQKKSQPPFKPQGSSSEDDEEEDSTQLEGLGYQDAMETHGFAWWRPVIDWDSWQIAPPFQKGFYADEPQFALRYLSRRKRVKHVASSFEILALIKAWVSDYIAGTFAQTGDTLQCILEFAVGFLMIQYRIDVWTQLTSTLPSSIRAGLSKEDTSSILTGFVPVTFANVTKYHVKGSPEIMSGNRDFHKGSAWNLLHYLFDFAPYKIPSGSKGSEAKGRERKHWDTKLFRSMFKEVWFLFQPILSREDIQLWRRILYGTVLATNPLLPIPDSTTFIQRRKKGGNQMWAAFDWPGGLGPVGTPCTPQHIWEKTYIHDYDSPVMARNSKDSIFSGEPPHLLYEDEFHGKSGPRIDKLMRSRLAKLM
jgi:hypothetical protein